MVRDGFSSAAFPFLELNQQLVLATVVSFQCIV